MDRSELLRLARLGAVARLTEIEQERQAILRQFPNLRGGGRGTGEATGQVAANGRRRRSREMSAARRKAVSERMRKYWAARREASGDGRSTAAKPAAARGRRRRGPRRMSAAARKRISLAQKARWAKLRAAK
jgi:hypothetical protein